MQEVKKCITEVQYKEVKYKEVQYKTVSRQKNSIKNRKSPKKSYTRRIKLQRSLHYMLMLCTPPVPA